MTPFTICLSPGHTPTAPGATRGTVHEYGLSSAIIGDMIHRLSKLSHIAWSIGAASNSAQVERINQLAPNFGLELHFNANVTADVNGSMVLHAGSQRGIDLANAIQRSQVAALGTKNAGIHKAHYQLDRRKPIIEIIKNTACPFVVVEPLYFSNDSDFEKIDIPAISIALVRGCVDYWEATR